MKLLFDQNISYKLVQELQYLFPDSSHVRLIGLETANDINVWQYARVNDFVIVTLILIFMKEVYYLAILLR